MCADDKAPDTELKELEATRMATKAIVDGSPVPREKLKHWRVVVKGNTVGHCVDRKATAKATSEVVARKGKVLPLDQHRTFGPRGWSAR